MARFIRFAALCAVSIVLVNCPTAPKPPQGTAAAPAFTPAEGEFSESQSVTIASSTEGAEIRYTTDSSVPDAASGTVYTGPIAVSSTTTIRAIASKTGMNDSPVVSATFTIKVPVADVPIGPITTTPVVPPVSDAEVTEARNAIARAREVDADYFDPDNFSEARRLFDEAIDVRTGDPAAARKSLAGSKEAADLSFDNSVDKSAQLLAASMEAARQRLLAIQADKFLPADYDGATAGIEESAGLFADKDYAGARARAYQALKEMSDLRGLLETRLATVRGLKVETEQLMKEAESSDAYSFAPGQKDIVTSFYREGIDAWNGYKLDDAEESFGAAREAARDTLRIARAAQGSSQEEQKRKAEALQEQVMQSLLDASKLTVVTEDGTVIKPQNWTDEDFLKQIDSLLEEERQGAAPGGTSLAVPAAGTLVVLAEDATVSLLQQARDLWAQGLKEKAAGNYGKAQDYFNEAQRYIDIYKSYAVKGVYTVRLIPDRRDCLWRIAEYADIYGDPYKWPAIWRRNRKLIQNPDLIYPGWQLVIPPQ